jgi:2-haloacid dehalogenase
MSRRDFLTLLPAAGLALAGSPIACSPPALRPDAPARPAARARRKVRAICFDLFTLFDPRGVIARAESIVGAEASSLCEAWRTRQFEYSWLRAAAGQYVDFEEVTDEALRFAAKARSLTLSSAERRILVQAYSQLSPWPDTHDALRAWKGQGLRLAPLANYAPAMLDGLLERAGLTEFFVARISTDAARTFKPDPRAYALGESRLGLQREEIAFAAFGGWDAAGAKWFGFPTFWLNRLGVPQEELVEPDGKGSTLAELAKFVATWSRA